MLGQLGNEVARKKWRAKWTEKAFGEPDNTSPHKVRDFIRMTYIDKAWVGDSSTPPTPTSVPTSPKPELKAPPSGRANLVMSQPNPPIASLIDINDTRSPEPPVVNPFVRTPPPTEQPKPFNPFDDQSTTSLCATY